VHVNALLQEPTISNPDDAMSGWQGIPRNMTGLPAMLKKGGYKTYMVGKWVGDLLV
jgi:arylsulfatase A-like enzyme